MPLPDYSPRSDSFGNWYFGGFQVDSAVETGYGAGTSINTTQSDWNAFLDAALGSTNWAVNSFDYYYRFPVAYEPQTGQVSTSNYRFAWRDSVTNRPVYLNTKLTGTATLISKNTSMLVQNGFLATTRCAFAVANQMGMWVVYGTKGTFGTLTATVLSHYVGWTKDPVFPTDTVERIRNAAIGRGEGTVSSSFGTSKAEGTTIASDCYAQSSRTCQIANPSANITDLCILDNTTSQLNIGSLPNSCIYHGTGLTIGQIYRIPPSQDPDGNTEQNIWLCADRVVNASNAQVGNKLIRVWSNNIT